VSSEPVTATLATRSDNADALSTHPLASISY
jgi:hypothetical protein